MAVEIKLNVTNGATFVGTTTITADVTGVSSGSFKGSLYVNNVLRGDSNLPLTFVLDSTTLPNGSHVLQVRAKYKGVTYKSALITVTVANPTSGEVTHSITEGATLDGTETWTATVTGISDINRVDFFVDQTVEGSDISSPYSFALDTTTLSEGNHEFYVTAVQNDGTPTDSDVVTAEVQNVIEAAPVNTVAPAITGTAQQGNTLSASEGTWTGVPTPTFSYQWLRCDTAGANCVAIAGATSNTYVLVAADVGSKIKARVRGTNSEAPAGVDALSAATATVTAIGGSLPVNTVAPTLSVPPAASGDPFPTMLDNFNRANENPLSQSGAWTTMGGLTALKVLTNKLMATAAYSTSYRGLYTNVEAAVALSTTAASGNDFELILRLTDAEGVSPIRDSNKSGYGFNFDGKDTYQIGQWINGEFTSLKTPTAWPVTLVDGDSVGARVIGSTLEVWYWHSGIWTKAFSMTDSSIAGAGAISIGAESTVSTFDDFVGGEVATGAIQQGQTLTCTSGTWTGADSYTYQWYRCDSAGGACVTVGAGGTTYLLTSPDVNNRIKCRVTAYNNDGSNFVYTALTAVVATGVTTTIPANTVAPTISGTAQQGQTLTANKGTWTGEPAPGYSYQWVRCDSSGVAIGDAVGYTAATYVALSTDVGKTMRVRVTATNSAGQTSATSSPTAVIAPVTPPPPPPPSYQNPIGAIRYAGSFGALPNKSLYRYYIVSASDAVAAAAQSGICLGYVSASTVESGYWSGVDYATASANNWLLRNSSGALITANGYPTKYLADVGLQAYRDAYFNQVLARPGFTEGVFFDDTLGTLLDLTGDVYPAKYPTQTQWYAAQRDFILDVGGRLKAAGRYVCANALNRVNGVNDGSTVKTWWQALAPGVSALCNEGWMIAGGLRRWNATNDWRAFWAGWLGLVSTAQNAGIDFIGVASRPTAELQTMRYLRASAMLDWDGGGGAFFWAHPNYNASGDTYNAAWGIDLGAPTAAKVASGVGWKRTFQNGKVLVNPTNAPATIDGRALAATDAYLGV